MRPLDYSTGNTGPSVLLIVYSRLLIGAAILSVGALGWEFLHNRESIMVLPAFLSPPLAIAAMLEYRGVMQRRGRHAIAAAILHFLCGGFAIMGAAVNLFEALRDPAVSASFYLGIAAVTVLAIITLIGGWVTLSWGENLTRYGSDPQVRRH